jgi:hydrogenase expression/formation protein HypC
MCLAIPSKVVDIDDMMATVDVYGARRAVNLMLMPEEIKEVDEDAAHEALRLIKEMAEMIEEAEAEEMDQLS